jgi:hypothetical protein
LPARTYQRLEEELQQRAAQLAEADRRQADQADCDAHLVKPTDPAILLAVLVGVP